MWQRCCCPCGASRRLESDKVTCTNLGFFCGFPLPFYHSVHLCSLLASELLHRISTISSLAAALLSQTGSLQDESLTLKRCQGRKYYTPASSDVCWGLKQGLWKGRSHQWADCCSKWGTLCSYFWLWVLVILLVMYCGSHPMPLETTKRLRLTSVIVWSGLQPTEMPLFGFTAIAVLGIVLLVLSYVQIHPPTPHKQCFTGARYNPWWQKEGYLFLDMGRLWSWIPGDLLWLF